MTFIAGEYVVEYNNNYVGEFRDGINLEIVNAQDGISGGNLGDSIQDAVYRGANVFLSGTINVSSWTNFLALAWPVDTTFGECGLIGQLATAAGNKIELDAVASTGAATAWAAWESGATHCILAPGFPIRVPLNARSRAVPIRLQLLPFLDSVVKWWKTTTTKSHTVSPPDAFLAGEYTAAWGTKDSEASLGATDGGVELEWVFHWEPVRAENYGDSIQDLVYRGGDVFCQMTCVNGDNAAVVDALWPFDTTTDPYANSFGLYQGVIGRTAQNLAKSLKLTDTDNTPGATYPATLQAWKAIIAPGFPVSQVLAARLRRVPLRFQLLPFDDTQTKWFNVT